MAARDPLQTLGSVYNYGSQCPSRPPRLCPRSAKSRQFRMFNPSQSAIDRVNGHQALSSLQVRASRSINAIAAEGPQLPAG